MDKKWKNITCDCGTKFEEKIHELEGIKSEALVCPKCGYVTLTREQLEKFRRLQDLHDKIDNERKIIRIGNSMGITLPESLREFGVKIGRKVKIKALTRRSFKVSF